MGDDVVDEVEAGVGAFEVSQIISMAVAFGYELHKQGLDVDVMSDGDAKAIGDFVDERSAEVIKVVGESLNRKWEKVLMDAGLTLRESRRWWELWK